jgi:two-component system, OmpR family, KDP operon response regulator KdpE
VARVLVVDDEQQVGHAIRSALERQGDEVVVTHTGLSGVELAATGQPDLLILDLHLPDIDGTEVVRRVRPWFPHPILVLSGSSDERSRVAALDAGADDFLTKPFGLAELQARLRALLRRAGGAPEATATTLTYADLVIDQVSRSLTVAGDEVKLTPTEWRLLTAFVANPGVLLTHQQLLTLGWSHGYGDETRQALRAHIRSLRSKLRDPATDPVYIRTESGVGYRWVAAGGAGSVSRSRSDISAGDALHDLSNVATALRLAVDLAEMGTEESDPSSPYLERMSELVDRAVRLIGELERTREAP